MTIYTFPQPFETALYGDAGHAVAYRNGGVLFVRFSGSTTWAAPEYFTPPPPIPAAARKPKVGEVWIVGGEAVLLASWSERISHWRVWFPGHGIHSLVQPGEFTRPATPEEAEPFRPLLEGLKASLGERA